MDMANFVSVKLNYLADKIRQEIRELLEQIWDGHVISNLSVEKFANALNKDKKNMGKELRLILCKGYGKPFKTGILLDSQFMSWLEEYFDKELIH
jgi:3-dehydroquinate synthetase